MAEPWRSWIPGVLSRGQVEQLQDEDLIRELSPEGVDASSFDLTLGTDCWRLVGGSVKPSGPSCLRDLQRHDLIAEYPVSDDGVFRLRCRETYLFRAVQSFPRPGEIRALRFYGQATARSSIGRLDTLARVIVDGMTGYEGFSPDGIGKGTGEIFIEVTPLTFNIDVKPGLAVSQLRLFLGAPDVAELRGEEIWRTVCRGQADGGAGVLTLDLSPTTVGGIENVIAFSPRKNPQDHVALFGPRTDPTKHWRLIPASTEQRLQITPGEFFILRSRERLLVPRGVAIYCRASDETIGEMRIHYAGFVHPCFGSARQDRVEGTPLIFEVRGHDFPVSLKHGEQMARLTFYRMSEEAVEANPSYTNQGLKLSNYFADWPEKLTLESDGTVRSHE